MYIPLPPGKSKANLNVSVGYSMDCAPCGEQPAKEVKESHVGLDVTQPVRQQRGVEHFPQNLLITRSILKVLRYV